MSNDFYGCIHVLYVTSRHIIILFVLFVYDIVFGETSKEIIDLEINFSRPNTFNYKIFTDHVLKTDNVTPKVLHYQCYRKLSAYLNVVFKT